MFVSPCGVFLITLRRLIECFLGAFHSASVAFRFKATLSGEEFLSNIGRFLKEISRRLPRWLGQLCLAGLGARQTEKQAYSAWEPARKVKTKEVVRSKSLIKLVVSFPGSTFHSLMSFNCSTVLFQNRWSGSRE